MTARPRLRKPELERTRPIRSWASIVNAPRAGAAQARPGGATAAGQRRPPPPASKPRSSVAARGVELGYKVVEEYGRQGRQSAEAFGAAPLGSTAVSEMQKLTERLFQYASDLGSVWLELLQRVTNEGLAGRAPSVTGSRPPPVPEPPTATSMSQPRSLAVEVTGAKSAEIQLALSDRGSQAPLRIEALRAGGPAGAWLAGLTLLCSPGKITVRLHTTRAQPAGRYQGVVIDADSNVPCGSLSVQISARGKRRAG